MTALAPSPSKRAAVDRIDRQPVTSSNLAGIGYDARWHVLAIEFKDGAIFHYADVPEDTWILMAEAGSTGSAYHSLIKGHFTAERMTGECPQCGDRPGIIGEPCAACGCEVYEDHCGLPHPEVPHVYCSRPKRHRDETHEGKQGRRVYGWSEAA